MLDNPKVKAMEFNGRNIDKSREVALGLDWSGPFYQGPPNQTLTCAHCEEVYRDHARSAYLKEEGRFFIVSRNGCPRCHGHAVSDARSDMIFKDGRNA